MLSAFMRQPNYSNYNNFCLRSHCASLLFLLFQFLSKPPRPNFCQHHISMIRFIITSLRYLICFVSLYSLILKRHILR